ncbi:MAG: ABC transporter permease [Bacteroides sp.]|nr:ABC transporter permease [Bacteroides sp.]
MTWSYVKIAFRAMKRYRVQHLITITAIAVGFTCFIMGAYWYYWEHHFDTFHPEHDRIYALTTYGLFRTADGKPAERHQVHFSVKQEITGFPEIESSTRTFWNSYYDENGQLHMGLVVDTLFFSYFFSDFIEGTWIGIPFNHEYIVLTESMARRQFGDVYCVGERLQTERKSYVVAGVIKDYPANTEFLFEYLLLGTPGLNSMERAQTYVKVHRGTEMKKAWQKVEQVKYKGEVNYKTRDAEEWSFRLRSLPEIHLTCNHELNARFRNIRMLVLAGVLAFFSALINHLVLFIGQQQKRSLHNHTLSVIGAGTGSLVWKTVCELLLSLAVSFVLILVLIELVFPFFHNYTRLDGGEGMYMGYDRSIGFGNLMWTAVLVYLFCIVIYVGISLVPAVGMLRNRNTIVHTRWRRVLVALQVGIGSFFFLLFLWECCGSSGL